MPQSDPFDIAITAQAISRHIALVTSGSKILDSGLGGLLVVDAQA
jgi:PIN domain nuclease of toxin-antitoxin system